MDSTCAVCRTDPATKRCTRCHTRYCSVQCQQRDWTELGHRSVCRRLQLCEHCHQHTIVPVHTSSESNLLLCGPCHLAEHHRNNGVRQCRHHHDQPAVVSDLCVDCLEAENLVLQQEQCPACQHLASSSSSLDVTAISQQNWCARCAEQVCRQCLRRKTNMLEGRVTQQPLQLWFCFECQPRECRLHPDRPMVQTPNGIYQCVPCFHARLAAQQQE